MFFALFLCFHSFIFRISIHQVFNTFPNKPWFLRVCNTTLWKTLVENTVVKGEIARNEQFLLFPTVFSTHLRNFLPFSSNLKLSSANPFSLEESKICRLGKKGLIANTPRPPPPFPPPTPPSAHSVACKS